MNKTYLIRLCVAVVALLFALQAYADTFQVGKLYYKVNDDGVSVTITYCDNGSGDFVIPPEVSYEDKTYTVTNIGSRAFSYKKYTSITIPNTVTTLQKEAFYKCYSSSVVIPNSVTSIGAQAFQESYLTSIVIPESATELGQGIVYQCESLKSVDLQCKPTAIPRIMFGRCEALESVTLPPTVTEIGESAFAECSALKNVDMPNVETIGEDAFYECRALERLYLPNTVKTIQNSAFRTCSSLAFISFGNSVELVGTNAFIEIPALLEVNCKATTPPTLTRDVFSDYDRSKAKMLVPVGCVQAYKNSSWGIYFDFIDELPMQSTDVNRDGTTDIEDLNTVLNVLLKRGTVPTEQRDNSDINNDDKVDVIDLNLIINFMLEL